MSSNPLFEALDQLFAEEEATPPGKLTKNPHDSIFRSIFQHPEHAEGLIRRLLPKATLTSIRFDTLTLQPASFVDEHLKNLYADLLYSIEIKGRPAFIYLLLEHISTDPRWLASRMLGYEIRIWEKWIEQHPNAKKLPLILPLVIRHGLQSNPPEPTRFEDLYDVDGEFLEALSEHSVRLTLFVEDLKREQNENIFHEQALTQVAKLVLLLLKNSRSISDLIQSAPLWCTLMSEVISAGNAWMALARICRYIWLTQTPEQRQPLWSEISKHLAQPTQRETVMNIEEYLLDKGRKQGIEVGRLQGWQEGRQEGRQEAAQRMFVALLNQRFGSVSEAALARIHNSNVETIEHWMERILSAASVDEVLA